MKIHITDITPRQEHEIMQLLIKQNTRDFSLGRTRPTWNFIKLLRRVDRLNEEKSDTSEIAKILNDKQMQLYSDYILVSIRNIVGGELNSEK